MCLIIREDRWKSPNLRTATRKKLMILKNKNGEKHVQSSAYLLFCLIKLDSDVPLETHIAGVVKHPKTRNNDWIENPEAYADNSVLREPWWSVFRKTERFNLLIQN